MKNAKNKHLNDVKYDKNKYLNGGPVSDNKKSRKMMKNDENCKHGEKCKSK